MENRQVVTAFAAALATVSPGWTIDGPRLVGPRGTSIGFEPLHDGGPGHLDVGFTLPSGAIISDCVVGIGTTPVEMAEAAARLWVATTATAVLELSLSGTGEFADHYRADDNEGFAGWHAIAGSMIGYGHGDSPQVLQEWLLAHPPLPLIASAIRPALAGSAGPHGVKLIFGGDDIAEVRLDGIVHEGASTVFRKLPWPRLTPLGFVRTFFLLAHPA